MIYIILEVRSEMKNITVKLVLFDMDGTLLQGRSIFVFAEKVGFTTQLSKIMNQPRQPYEKSIEIAKLLQRIDTRDLVKIFREIPLRLLRNPS